MTPIRGCWRRSTATIIMTSVRQLGISGRRSLPSSRMFVVPSSGNVVGAAMATYDSGGRCRESAPWALPSLRRWAGAAAGGCGD